MNDFAWGTDNCFLSLAMNGVCETDVACNVDMEMEVYDEIPYNYSQPKGDVTYLNHELDNLDIDESPEDDVVETNESFTASNAVTEDMSSMCSGA